MLDTRQVMILKKFIECTQYIGLTMEFYDDMYPNIKFESILVWKDHARTDRSDCLHPYTYPY